MPALEGTQPDLKTESFSIWNETLIGEALICSLLSKAFYIYPEKVWLQSLIDEDVFSEAPFGSGQISIQAGLSLLQQWSVENQSGLTQVAFDEIQADYMSLFIGPGKVLAPPWESVYLSSSRALFQKETLQVRNWYRRFGLQAENIHNQPDDHIGIEFSFLAHLAEKTLQAYEMGNAKQIKRMKKAQGEFIRTHMSRWVPKWCADVSLYARRPFYVGMSQIAFGTLRELNTILEPTSVNPEIQIDGNETKDLTLEGGNL